MVESLNEIGNGGIQGAYLSEEEKRIHPFQVADMFRSATELYDKRISALTDLFHQTQLAFAESRQQNQMAFNEVKSKVEYMSGRIDEGISPTMQKVKQQNDELEKALLRLENGMVSMIKELGKQVELMDQRYKSPIEEWQEFKRNMRNLFFKLILVIMVPVMAAFITMWVWMNQVKSKIESLPTEYSYKHGKG